MNILFWLLSQLYIRLPKQIQMTVQRSIFLQESNELTQKIEFSNGEVTKTYNIELTCNKINLISIQTIMISIIEKFLRLENIILTLLLIIIFAGDTYKYDQIEELIVVLTTSCYSLDLILTFIRILVITKVRLDQQKRINSQECCVFETFSDMSEKFIQKKELLPYKTIKWSQLKIGDIVCLSHKQQSPADLLILDSSKEAIFINFDQRHPCPCTFVSLRSDQIINQTIKGNILDFKTKLNGNLQFTVNDLQISGFIKLKNDPKLTPFNSKNLILRGETLDSEDWCFGMAIKVGKDCIEQQNQSKENFFNKCWLKFVFKQIVITCFIIFAILIIPNIVYYSSQSYEKYFFSSLSYCLFLIPQNLFWINSFWSILMIIQNHLLYQNQKQQDLIKQNLSHSNELMIIQENEKKILLPIQKNYILNTPTDQQNIFKKAAKKDFKGFESFSLQNILNLIKTDIILLDNPENIFKSKPKVNSIILDQKQYVFNYLKLQDFLKKISPGKKGNYEKLLIDTNRQQTNDEQKTQDLELLLAEKSGPKLGQRVEGKMQIKKLSLTSRDEQMGKELLNEKKQSVQKKKSTRYIFDQSFARNSQERIQSQRNLNDMNVKNVVQSPKLSLTKQRSQFFNKASTMIKSYNNNGSQQISPIKGNDHEVADRLIGDHYNEQDFIELLFQKDNIQNHELLLTILCTNNVLSYYNEEERKLEFHYGNKYDEALLQFAELFNYQLLCCTEISNSRLDYKIKSYIKKVISIENQSKVYEVLALLEPTVNRPNRLSVLVRDPESFLLDEGSLLYTRIETIQLANLNFTREQQHKYNEQLHDLMWDGQKSFVYCKIQLNNKQTEEFLSKLSQLNDTYGNRSLEIENLFSDLEKKSQVQFFVGVKQGKNKSIENLSNEMTLNVFDEEKIFQTLATYNMKTCIVSSSNYENLVLFLRAFSIISKDLILHFFENNLGQLQFKLRQHIQYLLEDQEIMGSDAQKHMEKYILLNSEAFKLILEDEYLKYHFLFIFQFSSGLGAYQFSSQQKGQLAKLLKLNSKKLISVGNNFSNNYLFTKSDLSFSLETQNNLHSITQPNFFIKNIKHLFKILFFYCPQNLANYLTLIELELYRSCLIGFSMFSISFSKSDINLYYLLLFFLIPSNIFTCIFQQKLFYSQVNYNLKHFSAYAKQLTFQKNQKYFIQLLRIVLIALFDSGLITVLEKALILSTYPDGKISQTNQAILLFIGIELIEKSKLAFMIFDITESTSFKIRQILVLLILVLILIFAFIIVQSTFDQETISSSFSSQGPINFIFIFIFLVGLSYILYSILSHFGIQIQLPIENDNLEPFMKEINLIKSNIIFDSDDTTFIKQIKKIIDEIFLNKEIIDEKILKYVKGPQMDVDYMDKNHGFYDKKTELHFQDFFRSQNWQKFNLTIIFFFYEIPVFAILFYQVFIFEFRVTILTIIIVQILIQFTILFFQFKVIQNNITLESVQLVSFGLRFIFKILINLLNIDQNFDLQELLLHILFIIAFALSAFPKINLYIYVALQLIMYVVSLISEGLAISDENFQTIIFCEIKFFIILIEISSPIITLVLNTQFLQRSQYVYQNRLNIEQKKINSVLSLLMPKFIQERMSKGQIQIQEDQGEVTILFCDIYQFDHVIKHQQEKILEFLDTLFRAFDQLCQNFHLQKIETVGKTYMAAGGLKNYDLVIQNQHSNSTVRALETAIGMLETVKKMKYGDNQDVKLKIGIHYGRAIAGVIGMHKPQFSLIGDTVNTTSRVCSTSDAGFITLSDRAYNNVKEHSKYEFELRQVQAKGKGMIDTYRLILSQKEIPKSKSTNSFRIQKQENDTQQQNPQQKASVFQTKRKSQLKRPSAFPNNNQILNEPIKSPKFAIRELHRDSVQTKMIFKKQSVENNIDKKGLFTLKSKSFNQNDDQSQMNKDNYNAKTPGFKPYLKNWITKRESGIIQNQNQNQLQNLENQETKIQKLVSTSLQAPVVENQVSQQQLFISSADQLFKVPEQLTRNDQLIENKTDAIEKSSKKKKGALFNTEKKSFRAKSNQKILLPEEREKNQIIKISALGGESDSLLDQKKMKNQKSIKFTLDSNSAQRKSPELNQEKIEELEIPKREKILAIQQNFDKLTLEKIQKYKLDYELQENQFYENNNQKKEIDHYLLLSIYEEFQDQHLLQIRNSYIFKTLLLLCRNLLYFSILKQFPKQQIQVLILAFCQVALSLVVLVIFYKMSEERIIQFSKALILSFYSIQCVISILLIYFVNLQNFELILQICSITSMMMNIHFNQLQTRNDRKQLILIYLLFITVMIVFLESIFPIMVFEISVAGFLVFYGNQEYKLLVKNYLISLQLQVQIEKYETILQNLMPPHALNKLLNPNYNSEENFIDVLEMTTILFADIAGFTKYSSSVEPETVVEMLRNLFQTFDQYCQKAAIYKVCTIGDCYVCIGVLDNKTRAPAEEAQKVLAFGFSMIEIINHYRKDDQYKHLNMRIGVHTGKVLGGVVGTDIVRYDIYGQDVTIANLMESSGQEGKILVSEATKNLVESEYEGFYFEFAKDVYIPSKETYIKAYFVSPSESEISQSD